MRRILFLTAALNGLAAVIMGAVTQHGFSGDAQRAEWARIGILYGLPHAAAILALLALQAPPRKLSTRLLKAAQASLALGATLFPFSLYLAALGAPTVILKATPAGGTLMILGWVFLLIFGLTQAKT